MIEKDLKPYEALPILDHLPTEWFENMAKSGRWDKVPRADVFEIPEDHPLKKNFRAPYIVFEGLKRRATAQKYHKPYRVNVLQEKDLPDFHEVRKQTLDLAMQYYGDYLKY